MTGTYRAALGAVALGVALVEAAPTSAAAACPEVGGTGGRLAFTAAELARPHYTDAIAGGRLDLAACEAVPGAGRVTPAPDFAVDFAALDLGRALEFRTAGACDTVLLVAGADGGWHFDDDGAGGEDARIRIEAARDGRYHVWVGTYGPGSCRARLIVETHR
jgi:hypothetical protein